GPRLGGQSDFAGGGRRVDHRREQLYVRFAPESGQIADVSICPLRVNCDLTHCSKFQLIRSPRRATERPAISLNGRYGIIGSGLPRQSGLILPAGPTLPHFSVSSAMNLPKSAGVIGIGRPPNSASRALILASAMAALISLFNRSMISAGVLVGTPMPNQPVAS